MGVREGGGGGSSLCGAITSKRMLVPPHTKLFGPKINSCSVITCLEMFTCATNIELSRVAQR